MSGWIAGAGIGGALLSTGASLYGQSQQSGYQGQQLAQAQANYQLQKQAQEFQQRLALASRTDALGNKVYWDGGGWVTDTTPGTKGVLLASQANERTKQAAGGVRSELGQQANFKNRGDAGAVAGTALRNYSNNVGRPTVEGIEGRDIVSRATSAGGTRSALTDAVARNVLRSGGNQQVAQGSLDAVNREGKNNLVAAIAGAKKDAPGDFINQDQAWTASNTNKYVPFSSVASNISDTAVAPTQAAASLDANLNQAATYGSATYGRGGAATTGASNSILGVPNSPINYGGATTALTQSLMNYLKSRRGSADSGIDNEIANWSNYGVPNARTF